MSCNGFFMNQCMTQLFICLFSDKCYNQCGYKSDIAWKFQMTILTSQCCFLYKISCLGTDLYWWNVINTKRSFGLNLSLANGQLTYSGYYWYLKDIVHSNKYDIKKITSCDLCIWWHCKGCPIAVIAPWYQLQSQQLS